MEPDIGLESRFLPTPPAFDAPVKGGGGSPSEYCHNVWCGKARMVWLPESEKIEDTFIRFNRVHECGGRTDRHCMTASALA